jgi:diacylglycerol kinase family enzyme
VSDSSRRPVAAFIVNPVGVADLDEFREKAAAALEQRDWAEPIWWETTPDDPGAGVAAKAVHARPDLVIVVGGDGTVRCCAGALAGTGIPIGVLGSGTGNLLARNLGLPDDLSAGLDCALDGVDHCIDLGMVGDARFAVMAGVGLDAGMVERTPGWLKARIGWPAYIVGITRKLLDRPMRTRITIDDGAPLRRRARMVVVGNVGTLHAGIELLPEARPDDGLLDVVVLSPRGLLGWARALGRLFTGRRSSARPVELYQGRAISLHTRQTEMRELDGDPYGLGHDLDIGIDPEALVVRVPGSDGGEVT